MALKTSVTRKLDNGYVQVEVIPNKYSTNYYRVPEDQADSFQSEYKKVNKKASWRSSGFMVAGLLGCTLLADLLTKKMQNRTKRTLTAIMSGVLGGTVGSYIAAKIGYKSHQQLLYKYNAVETEPSK